MLSAGLTVAFTLSLLSPPTRYPLNLPTESFSRGHAKGQSVALGSASCRGPRHLRPVAPWWMTGGGVMCRSITLQDLDEVVRLDRASYGGEGLWTRRMYEDEMASERSRMIVASSEDRRIFGVASLSYVLDEGSIENIAVLPDMRGKGIGSTLLYGLLAHASSLRLEILSLEVRAESNAPAVALYSAFGFKQVGRRKKYYSDGEDALILSRGPVSASELVTWERMVQSRGFHVQIE